AGNDWQVEVESGAVVFSAPEGVVQPWFTLYNFEIEVNAGPGAGALTLGLANEAAVPSLQVAILGPEVPSVPVPELHFDPASLDFGLVGVGTVSDPLSAVLSNSGAVTATDLEVTVPDGPFALAGDDCPAALEPGASCTANFTFAPVATGPAGADAQVGSTEGATASLSLSGEGSELVDFFAPTALAVDAAPVLSDGNGVFEPGELTDVAPEWR